MELQDIIINSPQFDTDTIELGKFLRLRINQPTKVKLNSHYYNKEINCLVTKVTPLSIEVTFVCTHEDEEGCADFLTLKIEDFLNENVILMNEEFDTISVNKSLFDTTMIAEGTALKVQVLRADELKLEYYMSQAILNMFVTSVGPLEIKLMYMDSKDAGFTKSLALGIESLTKGYINILNIM